MTGKEIAIWLLTAWCFGWAIYGVYRMGKCETTSGALVQLAIVGVQTIAGAMCLEAALWLRTARLLGLLG